MAKQNFVAGGFYGKLGDLVGQRWKNIRTLRVYVIPHNPRTPLQQKNRNFFAQAVPYAQIANSAFFKCPAYDTSKNTQWAYRMSQAKLAIEADYQDLNIVPLYPNDFTPTYVVATATLKEFVTSHSFSVDITGALPDEGREYSMLLYFANGKRAGEIAVCVGASSDAAPATILFETSSIEEMDTATIFFRICSNDDKDADTIVGSNRQQLQKDFGGQFNITSTLESLEIADDGVITAVYSTPNPYEEGISGTVTADVAATAATRNYKDGSSKVTTADLFTAETAFVNSSGSVGVQVTLTPVDTQAICLDYDVVGNLNLVFNAVHTPSTTEASGTQVMSLDVDWQNVQPIATLDNAITVVPDNDIDEHYTEEDTGYTIISGYIRAKLSATKGTIMGDWLREQIDNQGEAIDLITPESSITATIEGTSVKVTVHMELEDKWEYIEEESTATEVIGKAAYSPDFDKVRTSYKDKMLEPIVQNSPSLKMRITVPRYYTDDTLPLINGTKDFDIVAVNEIWNLL